MKEGQQQQSLLVEEVRLRVDALQVAYNTSQLSSNERQDELRGALMLDENHRRE